MGKLKEYLKLIPKGLANIDKVVEGIVNQTKIELGAIPQEHLEIIAGRRVLCAVCPYSSTMAKKLGIYNTARTDEHCMHCSCLITLKTASLESNCGIEDYNKLHPEQPLKLKWEAVK